MPSRLLVWLLAALLVLVSFFASAQSPPQRARPAYLPAPTPCLREYGLRPGHEGEVMALLEGSRLRPGDGAPVYVDDIAIDRGELRFSLVARAHAEGAAPAAVVYLWPRACVPAAAPHGLEFGVQSLVLTDTPEVRDAASRLQSHLAAHERTAMLEPLAHPAVAQQREQRREAVRQLTSARSVTFALTCGALALGALGVLLACRRGAPYELRHEMRLTHALPTALQVALYTYWGLYFAPVRGVLSWVALQVLLGYALDALFSLALRRRWTLTMGPVPVVLSLNLFLWSEPGAPYVNVLALVIAFGSKALLRRGERHLFNPSALGAAVVGLGCTFARPCFPYIDVASPFSLPPNMTEVLLLLVLLPQSRLPIALVSVGAVGSLSLLGWLAVHLLAPPPLVPSPLWAPVFLALTLLASDPATIPATVAGRFLAGVALGALMFVTSVSLQRLGYTDYFFKVFALPVVNYFSPSFDRLAAGFEARLTAFAPRRGAQFVGLFSQRNNRLHMALFSALVLFHLLRPSRKASVLLQLERAHLLHATPAQEHRDAASACAAHPAYCRPFSFAEEWRARHPR